jgi:hypothetical protein
VLTLMMAQGRGWAGDDAALREVYAPFEPEIPWASLLPPLLPGTTGASGASPPTA